MDRKSQLSCLASGHPFFISHKRDVLTYLRKYYYAMLIIVNSDMEEDGQDIETVRLVLGGNTDAFENLLTKYEKYVFKIVSNHIPYDAVEEVAHNVFVRAFMSLSTFAFRNSFRIWLSKIAVRACYDFWRDHYKKHEIPMSSLTEDHQKWFDSLVSKRSMEDFVQAENRKEAKEVLQIVLNTLSAEDRMVLSLIYLEGRSVKDTADILGWSFINIKVRAYRLRTRLRNEILKLLEQGGGNT